MGQAEAEEATVVAVVTASVPQSSSGAPATKLSGAMMGDTPFAVLWGLGSNGWYANPIEGGRPANARPGRELCQPYGSVLRRHGARLGQHTLQQLARGVDLDGAPQDTAVLPG